MDWDKYYKRPLPKLLGIIGLLGGSAGFWGGSLVGWLVFFGAFGALIWSKSAEERVADGEDLWESFASGALTYLLGLLAIAFCLASGFGTAYLAALVIDHWVSLLAFPIGFMLGLTLLMLVMSSAKKIRERIARD